MSNNTKAVGHALKQAAKFGYKHRNIGSAAVYAFGYPAVAAFLASPELADYVDNYGMPAEQVWDAMFDTEALWRGRQMDFSERTLRSLAKYVVDEDIKLEDLSIRDGQQWLIALADFAVDKQLPIGDVAGYLEDLSGASMQVGPSQSEFIPTDDGGILVSPVGKEFKEEQVVCARAPEIAALLSEKGKPKKSEGGSTAAGFVLGVLATVGVSYAWRRMRG